MEREPGTTREVAAFERGAALANKLLREHMVTKPSGEDLKHLVTVRDERNPHSLRTDRVSHNWWNTGFDRACGVE